MRIRPMRLTVLLVTAGLVCAGAVTRATTVVPPTFTELVNGAQTVFVGEVLDTRAQWVSGPNRAIATRVTFRVDRVLKGTLGAMTVLEFLGGQVGEDRMEVAGMPRFRVGDRDVLFVDDRGLQLSPIVGFMHGRFRLTRDPRTGNETVNRYNYEPLSSVDDLGKAGPRPRLASAKTMTVGEFEAEVTRALRRDPANR